MRRQFSEDGFSFEHPTRRPHGWGWVGIVILVAATGCATIQPQPQPIDLSPLLEVQIDPSIGLSSAFPDYEALVIGGVQQRTGKARRDGVVDLVKKTYDSELDEFHSWTVDVSMSRFDTPAEAARDLDSSCYSFSRGGASGNPVRWQDGVYCTSPIVHLRNDPLNLYLPANLYSSWVFVRRDRIVLRLYERHHGSPKSAKNAIIAEIADRLSKY
jgi:hypothetical protein